MLCREHRLPNGLITQSGVRDPCYGVQQQRHGRSGYAYGYGSRARGRDGGYLAGRSASTRGTLLKLNVMAHPSSDYHRNSVSSPLRLEAIRENQHMKNGKFLNPVAIKTWAPTGTDVVTQRITGAIHCRTHISADMKHQTRVRLSYR